MQDITATINDAAEAAALINDAPSYTEMQLHLERRDITLMARDFPRVGRRCTNLTHGTEMFDFTAESLERLGFVGLTVVGVPCIKCGVVLSPDLDPAVTTLGPRCRRHF
jgi:hypothetical protein